MDRKATERVYAGGKDTERVEDGPDSADMEEERDVHDPGKYRCITLLSQVLKLLERVLDARIRRRVEGDFVEEQQRSRKGRGTADGMYVLRQMVEKRLEVQGSMVQGFVDLENAFDTVPREMVMATLRWMGVPEAEVRMVEGTYEKTTARVVVGEGASE